MRTRPAHSSSPPSRLTWHSLTGVRVGRKIDVGACGGIRGGVVVIELDAEVVAYRGETVRWQRPRPPRELEGALKLETRHSEAGRLAAGTKHGAIEPGIVSHEELHPLEDRRKLRPYLAKSRRGRNVAPADAVDVREQEAPTRWPNQRGATLNDAALLDTDQAHGACTITQAVRGFEVDCNEWRR